jgi:hypothetical protein
MVTVTGRVVDVRTVERPHFAVGARSDKVDVRLAVTLDSPDGRYVAESPAVTKTVRGGHSLYYLGGTSGRWFVAFDSRGVELTCPRPEGVRIESRVKVGDVATVAGTVVGSDGRSTRLGRVKLVSVGAEQGVMW